MFMMVLVVCSAIAWVWDFDVSFVIDVGMMESYSHQFVIIQPHAEARTIFIYLVK
jgi:hypothetical protein